MTTTHDPTELGAAQSATKLLLAASPAGPAPVETAELVEARNGLQTCRGKAESQAAIRRYQIALAEARNSAMNNREDQPL